MTKLPLKTVHKCLSKAPLSIFPKNLSSAVLVVNAEYAVLSGYALRMEYICHQQNAIPCGFFCCKAKINVADTDD